MGKVREMEKRRERREIHIQRKRENGERYTHRREERDIHTQRKRRKRYMHTEEERERREKDFLSFLSIIYPSVCLSSIQPPTTLSPLVIIHLPTNHLFVPQLLLILY